LQFVIGLTKAGLGALYGPLILNLPPFSVYRTVVNAFKVKVKKVKFTLEQAMKAQRGSRGIAVLFL
jgi:hypothetical protein